VTRVLALLAAAALVVGAVVLRDRIDGGEGGAGGSDGDRIALRCGAELAEVCRELAAGDDDVEVTVEDEATTAATLLDLPRGAAAPFDAWLAAGPWPQMVAEARARSGRDAGGLGTPIPTGARSPAVIVGRADRIETIATACGGPPTWACIGQSAGLPWTAAGGPATWGVLKPGLPAPDDGTGLVVLSQAVASQLGRTDYASNDFEDDPAFGPWFDQLVGAAKAANPTAVDPFERFLVVPAEFGLVGALEAAAGPALSRATGRGDLRTILPEPVATASVSLVPAAEGGDAAVARLEDRLPELLARAGWRVPGRPAASGVGPGDLPDTDGLPAPGVLEALRTRWAAVR
jgi:hypothetical protein